MGKCIGILTAGGDSPGLNAAIRGVGKAGEYLYDMSIIGFRDGFRGLVENRSMMMHASDLSGILTLGGTILGTSRDKPHKMQVGNQVIDMTDAIIENYEKNNLDALVCLGGGGTQKNALKLSEKGLNVITLPKTIDNDVPMTDVTFGFDTALGIATEAIDRLHSTAFSHHRIIVVEIMGHRTGWLTLGAGVAGGADVILIPEIPYDINKIAEAILERRRQGKHFSIIAVAEGAVTISEAGEIQKIVKMKEHAKSKKDKEIAAKTLEKFNSRRVDSSVRIAQQLEKMTKLETRVSILGYVQRGGTPSAADRLLATRLGTECSRLIQKGSFGVMVAAKGDSAAPVPLKEVVGRRKNVPSDHPWIQSARSLGTCMGD